MRPQKRVFICIPSHDRWISGFGFDLAHLVGYFVGNPYQKDAEEPLPALAIHYCQTTILPDGRQKLVDQAKKENATHILWLDCDMRFPKETLHMLLRHEKPIVGCNYMARRLPHMMTARKDGTPLQTGPESDGLVEVDHIGFGVVLTETSVFEGDGPHFAFGWGRNEELGLHPIGEDVFFCRNARKAGHQIWVDQELSRAIGHVGEFTYTSDLMERAS